MIGRSPALFRQLSATWREVVGPLRRALPWALLVAVLSGLVAGGAAVGVASAQEDAYTASAVFELVDTADGDTPVSLNRGLQAEQVSRMMRTGRADDIAARAASTDEFTAQWVPGPGFGQLAYRVDSKDPGIATKVASAVYDQAGFLGSRLMRDDQSKPAVDLVEVRKAAPVHASTAKTAAAGVIFGAFAGFALVLLVALPMRRPAPVPA